MDDSSSSPRRSRRGVGACPTTPPPLYWGRFQSRMADPSSRGFRHAHRHAPRLRREPRPRPRTASAQGSRAAVGVRSESSCKNRSRVRGGGSDATAGLARRSVRTCRSWRGRKTEAQASSRAYGAGLPLQPSPRISGSSYSPPRPRRRWARLEREAGSRGAASRLRTASSHPLIIQRCLRREPGLLYLRGGPRTIHPFPDTAQRNLGPPHRCGGVDRNRGAFSLPAPALHSPWRGARRSPAGSLRRVPAAYSRGWLQTPTTQ